MIVNFRNKETEAVWNGEGSRKLPREIRQVARRKLRMLKMLLQESIHIGKLNVSWVVLSCSILSDERFSWVVG